MFPATNDQVRSRKRKGKQFLDLKLGNMQTFLTIFITVFLAELGDKTQLATMLYSADAPISRWFVFLASSLALVVASALGVLFGSLIAELGIETHLKKLAGVAFILLGVWTLWGK